MSSWSSVWKSSQLAARKEKREGAGTRMGEELMSMMMGRWSLVVRGPGVIEWANGLKGLVRAMSGEEEVRWLKKVGKKGPICRTVWCRRRFASISQQKVPTLT